MRTTVLLAAGLCLPLPAMAGGTAHLDGVYVFSANLEVSEPGLGNGKVDGTGFGVRAFAPLSSSVVVTGEHQANSYDDGAPDFKLTRLGFGLTGATPSGLYVEYLRSDSDGAKGNGYGIHARFESNDSPSRLYSQVGYVNINGGGEHAKGFEYLVGLTFPIFGSTSGFVDYRKTNLKGSDSNVENDIADIRTGVRFTF